MYFPASQFFTALRLLGAVQTAALSQKSTLNAAFVITRQVTWQNMEQHNVVLHSLQRLQLTEAVFVSLEVPLLQKSHM